LCCLPDIPGAVVPGVSVFNEDNSYEQVGVCNLLSPGFAFIKRNYNFVTQTAKE